MRIESVKFIGRKAYNRESVKNLIIYLNRLIEKGFKVRSSYVFAPSKNSLNFDSVEDLISILNNEDKVTYFNINLAHNENKVCLKNLNSYRHGWKVIYSSETYEGLEILKGILDECEPLLLCKKNAFTYIQRYNQIFVIIPLLFYLFGSILKWFPVSETLKAINNWLMLFFAIITWYVIFETPYKSKRVGKAYLWSVIKYLFGLILAGIIGAIISKYVIF